MLRELLNAKIHRATVTRVDLNYEGSISVDTCLLQAAGILPFESVQVWNIANGQRFQTYALAAPANSGEICLNGAAARLAQPGDKVIIATFCLLESPKAQAHVPVVVAVDAENRIIASDSKDSGSAL